MTVRLEILTGVSASDPDTAVVGIIFPDDVDSDRLIHWAEMRTIIGKRPGVLKKVCTGEDLDEVVAALKAYWKHWAFINGVSIDLRMGRARKKIRLE